MKIINISLHVKPEMKPQYEEFVNKLVVCSSKETGNEFYGHFKSLINDNDYEIIEHWEDQTAVESHNETPHFQNFLDHINDYLTSAPEITRMDY